MFLRYGWWSIFSSMLFLHDHCFYCWMTTSHIICLGGNMNCLRAWSQYTLLTTPYYPQDSATDCGVFVPLKSHWSLVCYDCTKEPWEGHHKVQFQQPLCPGMAECSSPIKHHDRVRDWRCVSFQSLCCEPLPFIPQGCLD